MDDNRAFFMASASSAAIMDVWKVLTGLLSVRHLINPTHIRSDMVIGSASFGRGDLRSEIQVKPMARVEQTFTDRISKIAGSVTKKNETGTIKLNYKA